MLFFFFLSVILYNPDVKLQIERIVKHTDRFKNQCFCMETKSSWVSCVGRKADSLYVDYHFIQERVTLGSFWARELHTDLSLQNLSIVSEDQFCRCRITVLRQS